MNRRFAFFLFLPAVVLLLGAAVAIRAQDMPKLETNAGFDELKSLAGEWQATNAAGKPVHITYVVVSNGSSLLERLHPTAEFEMVTMYSPDGNRVAATHYCNAGNQPQMRTEPLSGTPQKFSFQFVRSTNLASPGAGHMRKLVIRIQDRDHFTQEWTWVEGGKPPHAEVFHFTRQS